MLLIGRLDSPFTRRVAVSMHHYGIAFERLALSAYDDFEALLELNPLGRVPALVLDDDEVLFDSRCILEWLDEQVHPEDALVPRSGRARCDVQRVEVTALGLAEKSVELATERFRRAPGTTDPARVARLERQIGATLDWLEGIAPDPWLCGDRMTRADVTATSALGHLRHRHPALAEPGRFPSLDALVERCEALPAFRTVPFEN